MRGNYLICDQCNFKIMYDIENTFYLKCPCCDKVLVDARAEDIWNEPLTIIGCGKVGDSLWVKIGDSKGVAHTCWKEH